jgi:hypothetical protein
MRKWMNERLKRRKKGTSGSAKDAAKAPEPLQPKYFENDLAGKPAAEPAEQVPAFEPEAEPEPVAESQPEAESGGSSSAEQSTRKPNCASRRIFACRRSALA